MSSKMCLVLLALCIGFATAGIYRKCDRLHHIVNLPYIAPTIADIGKCPVGCEPDTFAPITILYQKEEDGVEIENELNEELVIDTCKPMLH